MALTDANPAFGPAERKGGAPSCSPGAPDCWELGPGCWEIAPKFWKNCSEMLDLGLGIWGLDKQSGAWHRLSRALAPLSGAWISNWGLGLVI